MRSAVRRVSSVMLLLVADREQRHAQWIDAKAGTINAPQTSGSFLLPASCRLLLPTA
jgi:hypothetical protein